MLLQDSREPTLHGQTGKKILAKKICHGWGDTPEGNFPYLGTFRICGTIEANSNGHPAATTISMCSFIGHLQQIIRDFWPGEKVRPRINVRSGNQTSSWLFDTGCHHLYEQLIIQCCLPTTKTKENFEGSELHHCLRGCNELRRVYELDPLDQRKKIYAPSECSHWAQWQHYQYQFYAQEQINLWREYKSSEVCWWTPVACTIKLLGS